MHSLSRWRINRSTNKAASEDTVPFHTGIIDGSFGPLKVTDPGRQKTISREPLLIFSMEEPMTRPIATDLDGNVLLSRPAERPHTLLTSANHSMARQRSCRKLVMTSC